MKALILPIILLAACATHETPSQDRGSLGKADTTGTCADACGAQSTGGCYCDELCSSFGDCCSDVGAECGLDECFDNRACPDGSVCLTAPAPVGSPAEPAMCVNLEPIPELGICGGLAGLGCSEDEYCQYPEEAICGAADQTGICQARPEACTAELSPVCGCDGVQYGSGCHAAMAGTSVAIGADASECEAAPEPSEGQCGGIAGLTCPDGKFCQFAVDQNCGSAAQAGTCANMPDACFVADDPVCGCDGNVYTSDCEAAAVGISVSTDDSCELPPPVPVGQDCGGIAGLTCPDGQFCSFSPDQNCGEADQTGTCTLMPEACITLFDPVCGCDGNSYGNSCTAASAGVSSVPLGHPACPSESSQVCCRHRRLCSP